MSLKCSIFGHKFAEPDVERERDEQGSEVVITIRELETCVRCGETRVVSENKEVTTLETPDVGDTTDDAGTAGETASEAADEPAGEPTEASAGAGGGAGAVEGSARSEHVEGATDAEIIDAESSAGNAAGTEADAESGGAPAAATGAAGSDDAGAIPDAEGPVEADEGPTPEEDDGVILDASDVVDEPPGDRQPGEWPQESGEEEEPDWVEETEPAAPMIEESGQEFESAATAVTVPEGEFYCEECGFTTEVESSSLREGDFCPECQQGTLQTRGAAE